MPKVARSSIDYDGVSFDDFTSKEKALEMYYSHEIVIISNITKQSMKEIKDGIIRRNVPLNELAKYCNDSIDDTIDI